MIRLKRACHCPAVELYYRTLTTSTRVTVALLEPLARHASVSDMLLLVCYYSSSTSNHWHTVALTATASGSTSGTVTDSAQLQLAATSSYDRVPLVWHCQCHWQWYCHWQRF